MHINLAISPCPNDTFMFWALLTKKIPLGPFSFSHQFLDIQELNLLASQQACQMLKLSAAQYVSQTAYTLCSSGAAMGFGVGPLIIAREPLASDLIHQVKIGIPGEHTTAHLLFQMAFPKAQKKIFSVFSHIESGLSQGLWDAGVIIHETRFSYQKKGFHQIYDLGAFWEKTQKLPLPLGVIAFHQSLPLEVQIELTALLKKSILYAWNHWDEVWPFIKEHAQDFDEDVSRKHVELYVNDYSLEMGDLGREALVRLSGGKKNFILEL